MGFNGSAGVAHVDGSRMIVATADRVLLLDWKTKAQSIFKGQQVTLLQ